MTPKRFDIVTCRLTGNKLMITDHTNKGYSDEKFNCKYFNTSKGDYEYVWKKPEELEPISNSKIGFVPFPYSQKPCLQPVQKKTKPFKIKNV